MNDIPKTDDPGDRPPDVPRFETLAEYRDLIRTHDWHELRGKIPIFYSGKYTPGDLNPAYAPAAEWETHPAWRVAADLAAADPRLITISQTAVGRALEAIPKGQLSDDEIESLWKDASEEYARAAAKEPLCLAYVRNTSDEKTYVRREWAVLNEGTNVVLSDAPLNPDGTPPADDNWPAAGLDKDGRVPRQ
jgi:hypothetical protein